MKQEQKITVAAKKSLAAVSLALLVVAGCGCSVNIETKTADGGVFASADSGQSWQQKVFVSKSDGKEKNISGVNVEIMAFSPFDSQTIYAGTRENGLYVTYDGGENWKAILSDAGGVGAIAIDSHNANVVYAALGNKAFKTEDGGSKWKQTYLETVPKQSVTALAVDFYDPTKVYAGISDGRVLKSADSGQSWSVVLNPKGKNKVSQILVNPKNTSTVYVATYDGGIVRSADGGQAWKDISKGLDKYSGSKHFKTGAFDPAKDDSLVIVTDYGLTRTDDGGVTWQDIKLLVSPGTMAIYSLAINPSDADEIYYGTASAIYRTTDGGGNWVAKALPTKRVASYLLADPENSGKIYLGAGKAKQ